MAENAIEILIDVATQEGIASLDDFTKVLSDTAGKVGAVSDSIDELDGALSGIAKSGASAQDMAVRMVSTLEDFGIEVKDADGLVAALAGTLTKLGASGKEAADGVGLATDANKLLTDSSKLATDQIVRQGGALKLVATEAITTGDAMVGAEARAAAGAVEAAAAIETMGAGYVKVATTAELATPALMKAATWAGIGLAGLAYEGIKQYSAFNKLITQTITQAGEAPSKMGFLTGLAESVAKSTGQGLDDVANTIYRAASGTAAWNDGLGATKKQLADIVTNVSKLNVVGGIASGAESEQASRVVTALINSNIRGVGRSSLQAAALVNAVVGSGDMRLADLVPGIGRGLLSSAVANNLSAKDALAWVATLTSQGTTASVAGNYVKTGVNLLAHPSAQGVEALSMLGIKPGELENLMSGPGGLVSALSTLKTGMKQLNPSSMAKYFFHEAGAVYPGGSGLQGAVAKLQTWSAGELSPTFIKNWEANKLTPQEQTQATDLILTKAFGGSKQFATIAAVINNLGLVKGIEAHIGSEDTAAYFKAQYARTEATPSQQFKRMGQNLLVDLVNAGKTLTPLALTFGHIMTGVIDGLSKFKGVLIGFATLAMGLLGAAAIGKGAQLLSHLGPVIGAGYNRLGLMTKGSAFGNAMEEKANNGRFKYLNIYEGKKGKVLGKLGGEAISSGNIPATDAALSADGKALQTTGMKQVDLLEEIATNTRVSDAEGGTGGARFGGGGGAGAVERESTYAPQLKDPVTGKFLSYSDSAALSTRMSEEENASQMGAYYYGSMGKGRSHLGYLGKTTEGGATDAAEAASGASDAVEDIAAPALLDTGEAVGGGMLSGIGEMAGGIMGGPVGMMGMMMAPMLIGALTPALGKLGSLLGDWFGGGKTPVYNPNIKNPLDVTSAAAKLAAATKNLRAFQREVKNKAGKEVWVTNQQAELADMAGFVAAHKAYIKAGGERSLALRDANKVDMTAESYLYGNRKDLWSRLVKIDKTRASAAALGGINGSQQQEAALKKYISSLPGGPKGGLQTGIWAEINKHGTTFASDYKDIIAPSLRNEHKYFQKTFNDASTESAQFLAKHSPALGEMLTHGLFNDSDALKLNRKQLSSFLNNKKTTAAEAAQYLPQYAHKYHQIYMADKTALAATGADKLTGDARKAFEEQKSDAKAQLEKTDHLIQEMRHAADDTKLNDGSIQKLAKDNAAALVASGLPVAIANALATALSPYMKRSTVVGTGGPASRTNPSLVTAGDGFGS